MITDLAISYLVLPLLAAAAVLTTVRLLLGPSLADRAVALDMLAVIAIAVLAAFAVAVEEPVFIDLILALGLIAFLGTVAFASYLERTGDDG